MLIFNSELQALNFQRHLSSTRGRIGFRGQRRRRQDGTEFVGFTEQADRYFSCNKTALEQEFQPERGLVSFLECHSDLRDELGPRSRSARCTIVRGRGGCGSNELLANAARVADRRLVTNEPKRVQGKLLRADFQIDESGRHAVRRLHGPRQGHSGNFAPESEWLGRTAARSASISSAASSISRVLCKFIPHSEF